MVSRPQEISENASHDVKTTHGSATHASHGVRTFHNPSLPEVTHSDEEDDHALERVYTTETEVEYRGDDDPDAPDLRPKTCMRYLATRASTLARVHRVSWSNINPITELRKMTWQNWNYFFMGYFAWLYAAWAFFCVSVSTGPLGELYDKPTKEITWGLSLVLFVRSFGAITFGLWTDRYSRKWPYITCLGIFLVAQLCTPWCDTYSKFLGVRWLSGIGMGGIYACAAATAIEDAPVRARSFLSGLFFSAYAMGFIWAMIFYRAFENIGNSGWKIQFWFSCWLPAFLICWRLLWPETRYFTKVLRARQLIVEDAVAANGGVPLPARTFRQRMQDARRMVAKYWLLFGYLVLLLVGPNYLTHASQDLLPTMLRSQLHLSQDAVTVIVTVVNIGAITGGIVFGQLMEITGRRLALLIACVMGGCFTYPAFMLRTKEAMLGAGSMLYFCVFAVWGVLPIHLSELSPPDARALVSGLTYQLGNLASAASATIETQLADRYPIDFDSAGNPTTFDYAKVMAILTGSVFLFTFIFVFLGHEKFHRDLSSPVMKKYIARVDASDEGARAASAEFVSSHHMQLEDSVNDKPSQEFIETVRS